MAASAAKLESIELEGLAEKDEPPTAEVIQFHKPATKHTTIDNDFAQVSDHFELFLADLKADVERPLISSMVRDLRGIVSRLKRACTLKGG